MPGKGRLTSGERQPSFSMRWQVLSALASGRFVVVSDLDKEKMEI